MEIMGMFAGITCSTCRYSLHVAWCPLHLLQALLGPSGAGKSTLMDILAQRKSVGNLSGFLLVNGRPATSSFIRKTAYVPQVRISLQLAGGSSPILVCRARITVVSPYASRWLHVPAYHQVLNNKLNYPAGRQLRGHNEC